MRRRAADIIFETLVELGVDVCFAVVGGGAMYLDNALAINDNIAKYFNHHEQACAMAAEAYARTLGKPASVCVTSGPGGVNALNGVQGAYSDSLPMIVLSGNVRTALSTPVTGLNLRARGPQEYNIVDTVKPMTKYAIRITDPLSVRREVLKAYDYAMHGRRGPVWLDVPQDMQSALVEEADLYPYVSELPNLTPSEEEVRSVLERMSAAKRPVLLAGSGVVSGGALDLFSKFSDAFNVPILGGNQVADVMAMEDSRYFGTCGANGPRVGNYIIQNSDFILSLGSSLGFGQTGYEQSAFAPYATIVTVDADEDEPKKPGLNIDTVVHADVKEFFRVAIDMKFPVEAPADWWEYCHKANGMFDVFEGMHGKDDDGRVSQYRFWQAYDKFAADDAVVALGNNTGIIAKQQVGKGKKEQRVIANYMTGSMGYDLPAALGAAVASGKEVVCATGDGSIMMNLQELQTIKQYDLPVKVAIFSNEGYGTIRQTCKNFFGGVYVGASPDTGLSFPDFGKIADAFDMRYIHCMRNGDVEKCTEEFLNTPGRVMLVMDQLFDDPKIPRLMSRADEEGHMMTPKLEDLYPFVDQAIMDELTLGDPRE